MDIFLLVSSAGYIYPDQARQHVRPDLDPSCFETLMLVLKEFSDQVNFLKSTDDKKS